MAGSRSRNSKVQPTRSSANPLLDSIDSSTFYKPDSDPGPQTTGRAAHYKIEKSTITNDLSNDRPMYILSAYGPGKDAPLQLFGGQPREQSFEELRVRHYRLAAEGKQQEAIQEAQTLVENAEQQMKTALNDVDGAIKYICDGENEHPNRIDICKSKGQLSNKTTASTAPPSASPFGKPSGAPAFGQPSSTPAFGQPLVQSAFGNASGSTFGQPSAPVPAFSQASAPAFGQPAAFGRPTTSFGQPSSVFGQPSTQTSAFGKPSTQASAFGQPSTQAPDFGQPSTQAPAFGQPSTQAPAFGQPSAPSSFGSPQGASDNLRSNPFGQPGASTPSTTFGQPSVPAQQAAFGRPSIGAGGISGQPSTSAGVPLPATAQPPSNPFGAPTGPSTAGAFGRPSPTTSTPSSHPSGQTQANPFGQPPAAASSVSGTPIANAAVTRRPSVQVMGGNPGQKDAQGKLRTWKGMEVTYKDDHPFYKESHNSELQRIWFPDGPPTFTKTEDLPEQAYDEATKENYRFVMEHARFKGGMPLLPPRREWCNWNI